MYKNIFEVISMCFVDLIKFSEEGIEDSVQFVEENMDKFIEDFKIVVS